MNPVSDQPSLARIVWTDYPAFLALLFPLMIWASYLLLVGFNSPFNPPGDSTATSQENLRIFYISIVLSLICLPLLAWRLLLIRSVFSHGLEVRGKIDSIYFSRDRGRVTYTYTFLGQNYTSGTSLHRTRKARELQTGDQVTLVVDRDKPKRAFIRDLYL